MIKIKNLVDMPKETTFIVIIEKTESHYTPGDQRSRDYPGHGYPESWSTTINFEIFCFTEQKELEDWIIYNNSSSKYKVMKCQPLEVMKKVEIKLK